MHFVSSGERTRRRLNRSQHTSQKVLKVHKVYKVDRNCINYIDFMTCVLCAVLRGRDVLFIAEKSQNLLLVERSGKIGPRR